MVLQGQDSVCSENLKSALQVPLDLLFQLNTVIAQDNGIYCALKHRYRQRGASSIESMEEMFYTASLASGPL